MRSSRTTSVYLVRQVLGWGAIGLAAITVVFLSQNLVRMLDKLLLIGASASGVATIVQCVAVTMLAYTVPMAFLFGVLVTIGRMAADAEILALRACGLGLREIVVPIFALAALVSALTAWLLLDVEHRARRELRSALIVMTTQGSMIEPGEFKRVGDRIVYVRGRDGEGRLESILISDRSDPQRPFMIFAESGRFGWDGERGEAHFRLRNGDIHLEPAQADGAEYQRIAFQDFEYSFPVKNLLELETAQLRPKDLSTPDLRAALARLEAGESVPHASRDAREYQVQLGRRYALPIAPMLFALIGVPLAMRLTRGGRSWGVLLCAGLVGIYYGVLTFSQYLALEGVLPAGIALWIPNALCAAAAAILLARARRPAG
ncbi:MAG TPA: LptF/LptG family permease [Myxococcota bacterium]|jgi:lipopolysaccharide export system permease protein